MSSPPQAADKAVVLNVQGPIGPATSHYFERGLAHATDQKARFLLLRLDTPGGLDTAMREIIKLILAAPIPIIVYVAPEGARAASAGTFILYAAHVAAMAPATNLGAATPVPITSPATLPNSDRTGSTPQNAKTSKIVNDAVAYIRSLAQLRQRNAEWAETAVREGASLSAKDALENEVIDLVAVDIESLLQQLHGLTVLVNGVDTTLDTENIQLEEYFPDWRTQLLEIITNPNIAYILMLIGIYGLIFELTNPGTIISGVIGAISLLLALYAFQVLPVNYAGLALIVLGIILMVAEALDPGIGILGFGGLIAFVAGSILLMDSDVPGFAISPALIGSIAFIAAVGLFAVLNMALRARRRPVVSGQEEMIGAKAIALDGFSHRGRVHFEGALWNAETQSPVTQGQEVIVTGMDGLILHVKPYKEHKHE